MDITTTTTTSPTKIPDTESETPPRTQLINFSSFTNGSLKKYQQQHNHHPPASVVTYRECLKNHAASLGGHAMDGCGEFMPSPTSTPTDPASLKCAACGCHRNFHRREPDDSVTTHFLEFYRHPPPPRRYSLSPSPPPPPAPLPPSNYSYAPHMLLALSTAVADDQRGPMNHHPVATPGTPTEVKTENPSGRKRFRTKFTQEQKHKMSLFADKLGWKMQKRDEGMVEEFCTEVGIKRGIFKVWMHNNKNTFVKREKDISATTISNGIVSFDNHVNGHNNNDNNNSHHHNGVHLQVSTNGSSSSS